MKKPGIKIRKATINDYSLLKNLVLDFHYWECKRDNLIELSYARFEPSNLARNLRKENYVFFVAMKDNKALAYIGGSIKKQAAFFRIRKFGYIHNLFIIKGFRRMGLGKKLMEELMHWFGKKKIKQLKICVHAFNKEARLLYLKFGFKDYVIDMRK